MRRFRFPNRFFDVVQESRRLRCDVFKLAMLLCCPMADQVLVAASLEGQRAGSRNVRLKCFENLLTAEAQQMLLCCPLADQVLVTGNFECHRAGSRTVRLKCFEDSLTAKGQLIIFLRIALRLQFLEQNQRICSGR